MACGIGLCPTHRGHEGIFQQLGCGIAPNYGVSCWLAKRLLHLPRPCLYVWWVARQSFCNRRDPGHSWPIRAGVRIRRCAFGGGTIRALLLEVIGRVSCWILLGDCLMRMFADFLPESQVSLVLYLQDLSKADWISFNLHPTPDLCFPLVGPLLRLSIPALQLSPHLFLEVPLIGHISSANRGRMILVGKFYQDPN
jgi:hypothetical protein